jgi:hypothetical protein
LNSIKILYLNAVTYLKIIRKYRKYFRPEVMKILNQLSGVCNALVVICNASGLMGSRAGA